MGDEAEKEDWESISEAQRRRVNKDAFGEWDHNFKVIDVESAVRKIIYNPLG